MPPSRIDPAWCTDTDRAGGVCASTTSDWKTDGARGRGVFAQEVAAVLPAAVTVGRRPPAWQVDYSKFVPDLIIGWQQHEARLLAVLERLEARRIAARWRQASRVLAHQERRAVACNWPGSRPRRPCARPKRPAAT